jgi:D-psicose/D-tagatose/L-ribulose 3-epimerase
MQFDTGSLTINRESPNSILSSYSKLIGHVHASEPDLLPLGDGGTDHSAMHTALQQHLPDHLVSIEMVATKDEPHLQSIERAIQCAGKGYRSLAGTGK